MEARTRPGTTFGPIKQIDAGLLWPERCNALVSVSGYIIVNLAANQPRWNFDDATFDRTAQAFDNPDHVDIVIHNYRWRLRANAIVDVDRL